MQLIFILLVSALVFGLCYGVDKAFTRRFRSKAQHRSGMAVRANRRYGIFGLVLTVLGVLSLFSSLSGDRLMLFGGMVVLIMGICLAVHYLSFGIFYDGETFLLSSFAKKSREYRYEDIESQRLYAVTGGNIVIELRLKDGSVVSLQSSMDGVYPFLDTAFAGWCLQTGHEMENCSFYDPSKSWWFPHEEEV